MKNARLGMVRELQDKHYGGRHSATILNGDPDFLKIAEAYGIDVEKAKESIPAESIKEDVLVGKAALLVRDNAAITKQRKRSTSKKTAKKEDSAEGTETAEETASESEDK